MLLAYLHSQRPTRSSAPLKRHACLPMQGSQQLSFADFKPVVDGERLVRYLLGQGLGLTTCIHTRGV